MPIDNRRPKPVPGWRLERCTRPSPGRGGELLSARVPAMMGRSVFGSARQNLSPPPRRRDFRPDRWSPNGTTERAEHQATVSNWLGGAERPAPAGIVGFRDKLLPILPRGSFGFRNANSRPVRKEKDAMPLKGMSDVSREPGEARVGSRGGRPKMSTTRTVNYGNRWIVAGLLALFGWAYWTTLVDVKHHWDSDPLYSHGYLVPGFACVLLWMRRDLLKGMELRPSVWGLALVLLGVAMRLVPLRYGFSVADRYSILPTLAGICLGVGGWPALRWAWPGVAFLLFMLHLPAGVDQWLATPLQRVATLASTNALQTFGCFAVSEGNTILLSNGELSVEEACSGLRMLVTFCAMTTAVAMVTNRSWLQRGIIVASSLPLAVVCNVARITLTGIIHEMLGPDTARLVFHDLAGWLMILLGLGFLWLELAVLARLFVPTTAMRPVFGLPAVADAVKSSTDPQTGNRQPATAGS